MILAAKNLTFCFLLFLSSSLSAQQWTLDSCLAYATEHNKTLLSQQQNQLTASIDKKTAWAQFAPEVEFVAGLDCYWQIPIQAFPAELLGGEAGTFVAVPTGTPLMGNYGVQARMKLVDAQVWQNIKLSALRQQAAQNEFQSLHRLLFRNVNMAFLAVQQQQENLDIIRKRYDNCAEIHNLIAQQFDRGLTDKISLNQSESLLKEREENRSVAESALQNALLDLKFWMGYPLDSELSISGDKIFRPVEYTTFHTELLPDYDVQKSKVDVAKQQNKFAIAGLYPTLNLKSGYGQSGFGEKSGQFDWYTSGFVGISLSIPVFSPTKAYSAKRQKYLIKQAEYDFSAYLDEQQKEYLQKTVLLNDALKSLQIQQYNVRLAEENERLSRRKIEKGIIDMVQFKQIQQDLTRSQETLNDSQIKYLKQYVEIQYLQSNE
ncbi:MAG: TolC family protein [Tannerella sp.]|nr:TolC family protein [Tannerella sp.]